MLSSLRGSIPGRIILSAAVLAVLHFLQVIQFNLTFLPDVSGYVQILGLAVISGIASEFFRWVFMLLYMLCLPFIAIGTLGIGAIIVMYLFHVLAGSFTLLILQEVELISIFMPPILIAICGFVLSWVASDVRVG